MALNPRMATVDISFTWDGVPQRVMRGTLIDVPPGSALLAALTATGLGAGNLIALNANQQSCDGGVSVGSFMENLVGGGNDPYVWNQ